MSYFDDFFTFPSIHIDGDYEITKEERKEKMGGEVEFNPEYLICYTEVGPDDEVMFLTEAWYPSESGFAYARDNEEFPCTRVTFGNAGTFLIAWNKNKFKKLWSDFKDGLPKMEIIHLKGEEQIENFLNKLKKPEDE